MYYILIEKFGPTDERWNKYSQWAGLEHCTEFCSVDGIMRPNLFDLDSAEDWANCINEDFKTDIITNLAYAQKLLPEFSNAEIVGIIIDPRSSKEEIPTNHKHLGFDIIEGEGSISLLTNWGGKERGVPNLKLTQRALIDDMEYAYQIREFLRKNFNQDNNI